MATSVIAAASVIKAAQTNQDTQPTSKLRSLINKIINFVKAIFSIIISFLSALASIFSRSNTAEKQFKEKTDAAIFDASKIVADRQSTARHSHVKKSADGIHFDFTANSSYNVFTEIVERYVPVRKDGMIDPKKVIVVSKSGPVSCLTML